MDEPAGYICPDDPDPMTAFSFRPGVCSSPGCGKDREPVYTLPKVEWISCDDELPDDNEIVWAWHPGDPYALQSGPCTGDFLKIYCRDVQGAKWLRTGLTVPEPPND